MYSRPWPKQEQEEIAKTTRARVVIIETISVQRNKAISYQLSAKLRAYARDSSEEHSMNSRTNDRRGFLYGVLAAGALNASAPEAAQAQPGGAGGAAFLPPYARAQNYKSLKQSSYD